MMACIHSHTHNVSFVCRIDYFLTLRVTMLTQKTGVRTVLSPSTIDAIKPRRSVCEMEDENDGEIEDEEDVDYQIAESSLMFYLTCHLPWFGMPTRARIKRSRSAAILVWLPIPLLSLRDGYS